MEHETRAERLLRALAREPVQASPELKRRLIAALQQEQRAIARARAGRPRLADLLRAWWARPALRAAGAALLCLLLLAGFFILRPAPRALLTVHQGEAWVASPKPSVPEMRKNPGDVVSLAEGMRVSVDSAGAASLSLFDHNRVDLFPGAQLTLTQARPRSVWQPQAVRLQVAAGEVRVLVSPLRSPAEQFEVESPAARVSVHGTLFHVRVISASHTYVATDEGVVSVTLNDPAQDNPQVEVPAGYEVDAIVGQPLIVRPRAVSGVTPEGKGLPAPAALPLREMLSLTPSPTPTTMPATHAMLLQPTSSPTNPPPSPTPTVTPFNIVGFPRPGGSPAGAPTATPTATLTATPTAIAAGSTPTSVIATAAPPPPTSTPTPTASPKADLSLTLEAQPDPSAADGILTYILTVANHGPGEARGVVLRDTLPPEVRFLASTLPTFQTNGGLLTWDLDRFAAGESRALEITAMVGSWVTSSFTNVAVVTAVTPDQSLANNRAAVSTNVVDSADLAIALGGLRPLVGSGGVMTCTLVYTNFGPAAAHSVTVVTEMAAGVAFGGVVSSGLQLDPRAPEIGTLGLAEFAPAVWVTPRLAAGATGRVIFTATVLPGILGPLTHTAVISAASPDDDARNNSYRGASLAVPVADVSVTQNVVPNLAIAGDVVTYILTYTNRGPWAAEGVSITVTLPSSVTLSESAPLTWFTPTLAPGAGGAFVLTATIDRRASGVLESRAVAHSATFDEHPGDNAAGASVEVLAPALALGWQVTPGVVAPRQPFTYTLSIANTGALTFAAQTVSLAASPPEGFRVITATGVLSGALSATPVWRNPVPLSPGASFSVSLVLSATAALSPGVYLGAAAATVTVPGGALTATATISVQLAPPAVSLTQRLAGDGPTVVASRRVTLTLSLTNTGPSALATLPLLQAYDPQLLRFAGAQPLPEEPGEGMVGWRNLLRSPPAGLGDTLLPGESLTVALVFDVIRPVLFPPCVESRVVAGPLRDVYDNLAGGGAADLLIYDAWRLYLPLLLRHGNVAATPSRIPDP